MNILIITPHFHPENFRINDFAEAFIERGHSITVLTSVPNYPGGQFFEGHGNHDLDSAHAGAGHIPYYARTRLSVDVTRVRETGAIGCVGAEAFSVLVVGTERGRRSTNGSFGRRYSRCASKKVLQMRAKDCSASELERE